MSLREHIEEQIAEDLKLLKKYEDELRYARDPGLKNGIEARVKELEQSIKEREEKLRSLSISKEVQWALVLSGTIDEINKSQAEAIVFHLRKLLNDASITLKKIESGSIKLLLKGSNHGFDEMRWLFSTKEITEILGFYIERVKLAKVIEDKVKVFKPQGFISSENAADLLNRLLLMVKAESSEFPVFLIDLEEVEFMDSAGLMALIKAFRFMDSLGKRMILTSMKPSVLTMFQLTQLDKAFEIVDSSFEVFSNSNFDFEVEHNISLRNT